MAAYEGEERLLTVFADIHYYFSAPTPRPAAHRFDKGSYLYFYGNKNSTGGRLEIANNIGKLEQDAFTGSMDTTTVRQSHKHPTLCTVTVDGYGSNRAETPSAVQQPEHHWRLPNTDPRNEGKYLFRLHTLDIYFWTAEDANKFAGAVERKLEHGQVEILDRPAAPAPHEDVMSPVVQNLENVAIKDPAYHNGQTRNSRTASTGAAATSGANAKEETGQETPRAHNPATFQPLAYNPAAPAAPEPIKHREKTPPPVDGEAGTGLAGAAYRDHTQSMSPQSSLSRPPYGQPQASQGYISPQPGLSHTSSYASPPPSVGFSGPPSAVPGQKTSSVSSFAPPPPQSGRSTASPYTPTPAFVPPPQNRQSTTSPSSQQSTQLTNTFSPPPQPPQEHAPFYSPSSDPQESPATEILGTSYIGAHRQPLQHLQPQYAQYSPQTQGHDNGGSEPIGGYSGYQYDQQQPHRGHHSQSNEYDVHSQVYRPTVEEVSKHKPSKSSKPAGSPAGRLEENAGKADKKVNRFFKKLESRIG